MKSFIKMFLISISLLAGLLALPVRAQNSSDPFPPSLEKQLEAKSSNHTEVSLDKKMLGFAGIFMKGKTGNDAGMQHMVENLDGVYVREYEFDKPGQYTSADIESIRRQFKGPEWAHLVEEHSKNGNKDTNVYMKMVNGEIKGMFVLDAEPLKLDLVYIDGPIHPEELSGLGGSLGIPNNLGGKAQSGK